MQSILLCWKWLPLSIFFCLQQLTRCDCTHWVWKVPENGPHSMSLQESILAHRQIHSIGHMSGCFHMNITYYRQCQHSQHANKTYTYVRRRKGNQTWWNLAIDPISPSQVVGSVNYTQWFPTRADLIKAFPSLILQTRNLFHFVSFL